MRRRDLVQQVALDARVALLELTSAAERLAASDERLALAEQELAPARRRNGRLLGPARRATFAMARTQ